MRAAVDRVEDPRPGAPDWPQAVDDHYASIAEILGLMEPDERVRFEDDYAQATGVLPEPMMKQMRAGLLSDDPAAQAFAATRLDRLMDPDPDLVSAIPEDERRRARAIAELADLGLPPARIVELAAEKLSQRVLPTEDPIGGEGGADGEDPPKGGTSGKDALSGTGKREEQPREPDQPPPDDAKPGPGDPGEPPRKPGPDPCPDPPPAANIAAAEAAVARAEEAKNKAEAEADEAQGPFDKAKAEEERAAKAVEPVQEKADDLQEELEGFIKLRGELIELVKKGEPSDVAARKPKGKAFIPLVGSAFMIPFYNSRVEELEAKLKAANEELTKANAALREAEQGAAEPKAMLTNAEKALEDAEAELKGAQKELKELLRRKKEAEKCRNQ